MSACDLLYMRRSCEQRVVLAPALALLHHIAIAHRFSSKRETPRSLLTLWFCCLWERSTTENCSLRRLGLADNSYDEIGAYHLSEALKETSFQIYLDLSHNQIGDAGASSISTVLNENSFALIFLTLRGNRISNTSASSLSTALLANSILTHLDLSANSIGDAGACSLSKALTANSSLTNLDLSYKIIGDPGASSLSTALNEDSSVQNTWNLEETVLTLVLLLFPRPSQQTPPWLIWISGILNSIGDSGAGF